MEECHHLMHLFECYEMALGQAINRQKTSIFFSKNTILEVKYDIQASLGARIMEDCEVFLSHSYLLYGFFFFFKSQGLYVMPLIL